ncbi:MAG TPA: deoxyribonuclease IV [Chloroflexota bacterium]|nr:deoxyribonuclease IV [Chloroflexota bacterium]
MRIGAHVSTSGGVHTAIGRAEEIGANCVQIFAGAPQRWAEARFPDADVAAFRRLAEEKDVRPAFIHSSYLLNFASADETLREKAVISLASGLGWADRLGAAGVITHLGSSKEGDPNAAVEQVGRELSRVLAASPTGANLLMETCAGQGNTIGRRFEQIGALVRMLDGDSRVQVCVDTAHIFEAGYDISSESGLAATLEEFDRHIGLSRLSAIHINDSKTALGSNVDRHENIGFGMIGEEGLGRVLQHPVLSGIPFLLEVPGMEKQGPDLPNVNALRRLAGLKPISRP